MECAFSMLRVLNFGVPSEKNTADIPKDRFWFTLPRRRLAWNHNRFLPSGDRRRTFQRKKTLTVLLYLLLYYHER